MPPPNLPPSPVIVLSLTVESISVIGPAPQMPAPNDIPRIGSHSVQVSVLFRTVDEISNNDEVVATPAPEPPHDWVATPLLAQPLPVTSEWSSTRVPAEPNALTPPPLPRHTPDTLPPVIVRCTSVSVWPPAVLSWRTVWLQPLALSAKPSPSMV